jgi:RNA polymerase sigma-B factor
MGRSCVAARELGERRTGSEGRARAEGAAGAPAPQAGPDAGDDVLSLFRTYRRTQDRALEHALVVRYLPLVQRLARRYTRAGTLLEDLVQIGSVGLMHAVSTFDPDREVKFETYAFHHIAGEIRHFLRDGLEPIRSPRWARKLYADMTAAIGRLQQELGRTPTLEEIAGALNITEDSVRRVLDARSRVRVRSMNEMVDGRELRPELIVHQRYVSLQLPIEDRLVVMQALERLADRQRQVIYYFFYQDLTQSEVAKRLGISQRHVSRLLASALRHLTEPLRAAGVGSAAAS